MKIKVRFLAAVTITALASGLAAGAGGCTSAPQAAKTQPASLADVPSNESLAQAGTVAESFLQAAAQGDGAKISSLSGGRFSSSQVADVRAQFFGPGHTKWSLAGLPMSWQPGKGYIYVAHPRLGNESAPVTTTVVVTPSGTSFIVTGGGVSGVSK